MEEQNTYLHRLLWDVAPKLYCEDGKSLFIDRDPDSFRHVLNYLRGYKENYFRLLAEDTIKKLKSDADFYQLRGLGAIFSDEKKSKFLFNPGPGVSADRIRQCIVYSVFTVGDVFLVTGKHSITYRIHNVEYLGVGLVSDSCVDMDREHHKVPNSCVYYMSGVFYSNYTFHRKEENLETLQPNDIVTLTVDMDKKVAEFQLKNTRKVVSLGKCSGVKFSVTMKYSSKIEIVNQT
ncbi:hypothetical protein AGDE_05956 [Angomonas deanei]|nr:hypothetical protein AGDE_05956 [Angomonas deanei]|eukprot:EPY37977.1 hypothetical protein AGDE_05956 [Angomonas deanei]